jgi:dTDP-4-dehydrorhamnose reductase
MSRKVIVLGAGGNIGLWVALGLAKSHEVVAVAHDYIPPQLPRAIKLDITRTDEVVGLITATRPAAVVNLSAMADPDACEKNPALARKVNIDGAANVAHACAEVGARLVYYSSDLVFDGKKSLYAENDTPNPLSIYGETKLRGEVASLEINPGMTAILRTAIVYGKGSGKRPSFIESTIEKSRDGMGIVAFTDQYRSFLYVEDSANAVAGIIDRKLAGVYHAGGDDRMSRYEFMLTLFKKMNLPQETLVPAKMTGVFGAAPRPADCSLSSEKLKRDTGWRPTSMSEGMERFRRAVMV